MMYIHRGVQDRLRQQGVITGDSVDPGVSRSGKIALHSSIPTHQPTIAIDFDGRICQLPAGGNGHHSVSDLDSLYPREGTRETLEHLYDRGAKIIIWTCRDDLENIEDWLDEYRIPYHHINDNPDQPTNSRKVIADMYLDDRGEGNPSASWGQLLSLVLSRMGDKLDAWTRRPKYGTVRHLVITGPSGAGKTTLSGLLSEALNLPVWKVDQERLWKVAKPFRDTLGRYPSLDWFSDKDDDKPHGWNKMVKRYRKTLKRLVRKALKKPSANILEGCHFLVCPGTLRGHKIVLLDPPEQTVINQRLMRDQAEGKLKPDGSNYTEREAKARFLYEKLRPAVDRMRNMDGVEVLQPHRIVSFVKELMEEMGVVNNVKQKGQIRHRPINRLPVVSV